MLQPMDQEEALKALEGHENILGPAYEAHRAYFQKLNCHRCGGRVQEFVDPKYGLFREGDTLPHFMARCSHCGLEFEPYTRIEVSTSTVLRR